MGELSTLVKVFPVIVGAPVIAGREIPFDMLEFVIDNAEVALEIYNPYPPGLLTMETE
jgi:hypothetical protein